MKNDMSGLVFAENPEAGLGLLTGSRSLAAVPFGGRYRIIDFILSSMVNSGIINIGITTSYTHQSLTDHLGTGKAWNLDRKHNGLFILPPDKIRGVASEKTGGIDIIHNARKYLTRCSQEYVAVADCNTICNMEFSDALSNHIDTGADITLICHREGEISESDLKRHILLEVDDDNIVKDIQVYPAKQKTNLSYMHRFIIRRDLLIDLVDDAHSRGKHIISKDIFIANLSRLKICAYEYDGIQLKIDNIKNFFDANLQLLQGEVRDELFGLKTEMPIYTKVKDTIPAKYGKNADVSGSIIADGCVVEGTVKNSILFRGVHIGKGTSLENCIIMQNSDIRENCMVANAIFDKEVVLRNGKKLIGQETYPMVIGKGAVI